MAKKLDQPVFVPSDYDDPPVRCETFGEYAREMMRPDPTYVILPGETEDLITNMVNAGSIYINDALRLVSRNYHYDDDSKEYIEFPESVKMKQLIQTYSRNIHKLLMEECLVINSLIFILFGCIGIALGDVAISAIESKRDPKRSFTQVLHLVVLSSGPSFAVLLAICVACNFIIRLY